MSLFHFSVTIHDESDNFYVHMSRIHNAHSPYRVIECDSFKGLNVKH